LICNIISFYYLNAVYTVALEKCFLLFPVQTYVQDKLLEVAPLIYRMLVELKGHFYVCGDCAMAEDVANTLQRVFQKGGGLDLEQSETLLILLRVSHSFNLTDSNSKS